MSKKVVYIGQYSEGTTSKMRADIIKESFPESEFVVLDTNIPFNSTHKIFRSLGFRKKIGPLIKKVNRFIESQIKEDSYEMIWVDKAIYVTPAVTQLLKSKTERLIHFTPDPAFEFHKSKLFLKSLDFYDLVVTTKSYELDSYFKKLGKDRVLYVTQGYDTNLHQNKTPFEEREDAVVFIGHHETEREEVIQQLIDHDIKVIVAGIKWESFYEKNKTNNYLDYQGSGVYGQAYIDLLNQNKMALGSVSKWVPEKHTTRTFEIPACGAILLTERNEEISSFFTENEVVFYDDTQDLISFIKENRTDTVKLASIASSGENRVVKDGRSYQKIISNILKNVLT